MSTQIALTKKEHQAGEAIVQPKWHRVILLSVLGYEGAGCLVGGGLLAAAPDGRLMDMPVDMMHGTFADFLIPGLILFGLGILTTIAFFQVLRRTQIGWFMACLSLGGLIIWFWVEIAILQDLHWLHVMWGVPVLVGALATISLIPSRERFLHKAFLISGILSSVLYVAINIIVPMQWEGYSLVSRVPSELSAIGAPTRTLWMVLATPYTFLILAFALGVWKSAVGNRPLRIAGGLMIAYGMIGFLWPFAPMHLREVLASGGPTFSDTMHQVLAGVTVMLYLFSLGFAAVALGRPFRIFSIVTFVLVLVFGVLTFMEAPGVEKNEPTPMIGVWERLNIGFFLIWVVVLAVILLRRMEGSR